MDFDRFKMRERYSHVRENEHGMLLLDYMTENFSRFDRDGWQAKIKNKCVFVNGSSADCSFVLKKHDRVSLWEDLTAEPSANLLFETVYEDGDLLVFNKPSDLCVHPTGPFYQHSLWFQAGRKYGELFFAGRLDRETSGLIIAARSGKIASVLKIDRKEYLVMVHGKFENYVRASGFLLPDKNSTIAKKRRFSFQDAENSESADTELFPFKINSDGTSVVKAVLHSGRMHQIRATMFSLGYPVVGDKLYGLDESLYNKISTQSFSENDRKKLLLANQALHCSKLEFIHPLSGDKMSFESPAPWMTDTVGY